MGLALLTPLYRLFAHNRRLVVPARRPEAECACRPDSHTGYRLAFLSIVLAVALWTIDAYVDAIADLGFVPAEAVARTLRIVGLGWLGLAAGGLRLGWRRFLDWTGHLLVVTTVGLALLAPGVWVAPLAGTLWATLLRTLSVLFAFAAMFSMQRHRIRYMGLSWPWFAAWVIWLSVASACVLWAMTRAAWAGE